MLDDLSPEHRQLLFRFLCSFAWADGEVADAERRFVHRLMDKVKLRDDERLDVDGWLDHPPNANDVQPGEVPLEHRHLFVDAMRAVIFMDGKVTDEEEFRLEALRRALSR